jgi:hypothetical protein
MLLVVATPQYPKLSEEQKARVLDELLREYQLSNLRPQGGEARACLSQDSRL